MRRELLKVRHQENKVVLRSLSGLKRMPGQTWLMWLHQKTWILTGTTGFVWIIPLLAFPYKLWGRPIVFFISNCCQTTWRWKSTSAQYHRFNIVLLLQIRFTSTAIFNIDYLILASDDGNSLVRKLALFGNLI